jgi:hypothetical protein
MNEENMLNVTVVVYFKILGVSKRALQLSKLIYSDDIYSVLNC